MTAVVRIKRGNAHRLLSAVLAHSKGSIKVCYY